MANVGNRILKQNIFQAYDMPINITLAKVEEQVIRFINDHIFDQTDARVDFISRYGVVERIGKKLADKYVVHC